MDFFRGLPWKWIVPVLLIAALGWTVQARAAALGRADAAAARSKILEGEKEVLEDSNESLTVRLADADSSKAVRARADSIRIAELDQETEELERTVRDLEADDRLNAEAVGAALTDLEAAVPRTALPALRGLTSAYEARVAGLSGQIVALTGLVGAKDEEIEILEAELGAERFARSAADVLTAGLRRQIVVLEEITDTQSIEIGALRDAVAPGFLLRLWQNAELAIGAAAFGGFVTHLALSGD